jgi:hypothetical protein
VLVRCFGSGSRARARPCPHLPHHFPQPRHPRLRIFPSMATKVFPVSIVIRHPNNTHLSYGPTKQPPIPASPVASIKGPAVPRIFTKVSPLSLLPCQPSRSSDTSAHQSKQPPRRSHVLLGLLVHLMAPPANSHTDTYHGYACMVRPYLRQRLHAHANVHPRALHSVCPWRGLDNRDPIPLYPR